MRTSKMSKSGFPGKGVVTQGFWTRFAHRCTWGCFKLNDSELCEGEKGGLCGGGL